MSFGYARDSLADLQKLYNTTQEEDDALYTIAPKTSSNISSVEEDNEDDFLFFDTDDEGGHDVHLNDDLSDGLAGGVPIPMVEQQKHPQLLVASLQKKEEPTVETIIKDSNGGSELVEGDSVKQTLEDGLTQRSGNLFNPLKKKDLATGSSNETQNQNHTTTNQSLHNLSPSLQSLTLMKNQISIESSTTATTDITSVSTTTTLPTEQSQQLYDNVQVLDNNTTTKTLTRSYSHNSTMYNNTSRENTNGSERISSSSTSNKDNKSVTYYSGFDYASYEEEYNFHQYIDPYAPSNSGLLLHQQKQKNMFCCIFGSAYSSESDSDSSESDCDSSIDESNNNASTFQTGATSHMSKITPDERLANDRVTQEDDTDRDVSIDVSRHGRNDDDDDDLSICNSVSSDKIDTAAEVTNSSKSHDNVGPKILRLSDNESEQTVTIKANRNEKVEQPSKVNSTAPKYTNTSEKQFEKKPLKGILKRTVINSTLTSNKKKTSLSTSNSNEQGRRRTILPSYETKSFDESSEYLNKDSSRSASKSVGKNDASTVVDPPPRKTVSFSPMARVMNVTARADMSFFSRSLIWWQKNDYDDFKKTGRIIAQAMLCGGSEIWLQTSNAWGKKLGGSPLKRGNAADQQNALEVQDNQDHLNALKKYGVTLTDEEEKDEDVGSKWWCKFGHSRRGLEHIVSIEEGRQRQRFVNIAVRAVLDEQRRQRITRKDPSKIAAVSMQYTSWARDLAIASGAADAEAVKSNFNSQAKCRIHHLRRGLNGKTAQPSNVENLHIPSASFILSANSALTAKVLDANTDSSLRMKHMVKHKKSIVEEEKKSSASELEIAKKAAGFQF